MEKLENKPDQKEENPANLEEALEKIESLKGRLKKSHWLAGALISLTAIISGISLTKNAQNAEKMDDLKNKIEGIANEANEYYKRIYNEDDGDRGYNSQHVGSHINWLDDREAKTEPEMDKINVLIGEIKEDLK